MCGCSLTLSINPSLSYSSSISRYRIPYVCLCLSVAFWATPPNLSLPWHRCRVVPFNVLTGGVWTGAFATVVWRGVHVLRFQAHRWHMSVSNHGWRPYIFDWPVYSQEKRILSRGHIHIYVVYMYLSTLVHYTKATQNVGRRISFAALSIPEASHIQLQVAVLLKYRYVLFRNLWAYSLQT